MANARPSSPRSMSGANRHGCWSNRPAAPRQMRSPLAGIEWSAACGNACRETYTAGGKPGAVQWLARRSVFDHFSGDRDILCRWCFFNAHTSLHMYLSKVLPHKISRGTDELSQLSALLYRCSRVAPVFERVLIAIRCTWRSTPVHPASTIRHSRRSTWQFLPCPSTTTWTTMHGKTALHGVVTKIQWDAPSPLFRLTALDGSYDSLSARVHVDMFHDYFLLTLSTMFV